MSNSGWLGPFTTAFTYPSSCTVAVQQCTDGCSQFWQAQTCSDNPANTQGVQDNAACWPPRYDDAAITTGEAVLGWGYYSPALSCPVGYATACSATAKGRAGSDGFAFQFPLIAGETAIGCCPTGFRCQAADNGQAQTCVSVASTGSFAAVQCSGGNSNGFHFYDLPATFTHTDTYTLEDMTSTSLSVSTGTLSSVNVVAPLFQLHYQATDLPATSTSTSGTISATGTTHLPVFTTKSGGGGGGGGLSTGAVVGIGVGVGLGALAILGAVAGAFLHSRKRKQDNAAGALGAAELVANEPKPPGFYYSQTVMSSGQPHGEPYYR